MKKFLALTCVLALAFSTTVCAAETVVPAKDFPILDKLAEEVDKSLPEYTSNAVCEMDGVEDLATIAQGDGCVLDGQLTSATFIVDKVDVGAIRYAQENFTEWNAAHDRRMAEIDGMTDMLSIVTGKEYVITENGLEER